MIVKILRFFARGEFFVVACAWLVLLLILGTLAQRDIGLFQAQERYFSSWVVTFGLFPAPGGRTTMTVIFLSLGAYLLQRGIWRWRKAGLLVAHLGALLLLIGGFLTAYYSLEGTMVIREGETVDYVMDSVKRELVVQHDGDEMHRDLAVFPGSELVAGQILEIPELPATIELLEFHGNCLVAERHSVPDASLKGLARKYRLMPSEISPEPEQNNACAMVRITQAAVDTNGIYAVIENASLPEHFESGGRTLLLSVRSARMYLPFRLALTDFSKVDHPGTTMAKSYESTLDLQDGEMTRQVVIAMNEPLRYRGFTFYQSSFFKASSGEATVLAVVKNHGRMFPYLASIVMCIGLLIHLALLLFWNNASQEKRKPS